MDYLDDENSDWKLSHNLINQLTVIVICCDLLRDDPLDAAENSRRLSLIRTAARSIGMELGRLQPGYGEIFPAAAAAKPQLLS